MRRRRQLGMECSRSPRIARGLGGALLGGVAGGVLGLLVGGAVAARRLASGAPGEPVSTGLAVAVAVAVAGVGLGAVAGAVPPEC